MQHTYLRKETNEIQRVLALRNSRNKRYRYGQFIIEGTTAIEQAFKHNWPIESIFYNSETKLSEWAKGFVSTKTVENIYALPKVLMEKIADKEDCPEIIAIGKTDIKHFSLFKPLKSSFIVVLDEPKSAGNLGMIIRSAVAFGIDAVLISGHGADEYDPKYIRSSIGCFFSIPIYRVEGITRFIDHINALKQQFKIKILATSEKGEDELSTLAFDNEVVFLVLGNETKGISKGYCDIANSIIRIQTTEAFTSLNIGAAASIFFYEYQKQKNNKLV